MQKKTYSPEKASWGGYRSDVPAAQNTCLLFGDASLRVNWRVVPSRPRYGSIYDGSLDPERVGVGYPLYAPHGNN